MVNYTNLKTIMKSPFLLKYHKIGLFIIILSTSLYINNSLKDVKWSFFNGLCLLLDNSKRIGAIWIISIIICVFYYYYQIYRNDNAENSKFVFRTSVYFLDCISSFCTYSTVINSSLNLISSIAKDFNNQGSFLPKIDSIDYFTLLGCATLPFLWGTLALNNLLILACKPKIIPTNSFLSNSNESIDVIEKSAI